MTSDWTRIDAVLRDALDLEADAREAFVRRACGGDAELEARVRRLLDAAERSGDIPPVDVGLVAEAVAERGELDDEPLKAGDRVGAFRVVERIGAGGMGSVYLAERADGQFEQRVAIKIVRGAGGSAAPVRRFLQERQILARLQHPNIARLLDGGLTDTEIPYVVMEYVDGSPLTEHCRRADLDLDGRLELFEEVCGAVHYAHGHGVIHRDLKPSNILVATSGRVMLLDFGIARLTGDETGETLTRTGMRVLTPAYASPEQVVGMNVTEASDVYQLGLLLYELIAGRLPTGPDAPPPTTVAGGARGTDLDRVCAKALSVEPEARYPSAELLGLDVRRYREGLPVDARPATAGYRLRRFLSRNRVAAIVGAALAAGSLLAGYLVGQGGDGPARPVWIGGILLAVAAAAGIAAVRRSSVSEPAGAPRPPEKRPAGSSDTPARATPDSARSAPSTSRDATGPTSDPHTIAILPFEATGGEDTADPFAEGLHEDLLTELSRLGSLTVISRSSVARYAGREQSIRQIGRELGAGTVIEGTVRRAGSRARLNIRLLDAASETQRWAERYDCEFTAVDIFDLQGELATKIATTLQAELTTGDRLLDAAPPTDDVEAYRHFVEGRRLMLHRSHGQLARAGESFQRAVERDPEYALAWAGLANALVMQGDYYHVDPDQVYPRAEAAVTRALELQPELPEGHTTMGNLLSARRDVPGAIAHHERAIEVRPGYAQAHQWLCWCRLLIGDAAGALAAGRRATRLDPLDAEGRTNFAFAHLGSGDLEQAVREAARAEAAAAEGDYMSWTRGLVLHAMGREGEAEEALSRLSENWSAPWRPVMRAIRLVDDGRTDEALDLVRSADGELTEFHTGVVHAALGRWEDALDGFESAVALRWPETLFVRYAMSYCLPTPPDSGRYVEWREGLDRSWGVAG
ncbi:MAG: protein kinase [Gemmatimonadota bacterium]|nr:protein kinase [Gemmatimonadota bacterium]